MLTLLSLDLSTSITIVTAIAGVTAVVFEVVRVWNSRYDDCAKNVSNKENNLIQLSAAIQLRMYIQDKLLGIFSHRKNATYLICSILKDTKNGHLQKVLGDSLSCVKKGHGLDLQEANLHQICIKPPQRVEFEISGDPKDNTRSIDLSNSDLYRADLSESTICNVVFDKGVFYDTLIYGTSFHNCSFVGANFDRADLRGTKFYACDLTGANFNGARRVSLAMYNPDEKSKKTQNKPLIKYLDESGIFGPEKNQIVYDDTLSSMSIFLSKLGGMTVYQQIKADEIEAELKRRYQVEFKKIERREYRDSGQLIMIQDTMNECNGVVVFAFAHMHVYDGEIRADKNDNMAKLKDSHYSSPWLQIETAFARSAGLPCLIIAEDSSITRNGIFDDEIIKNDDYMFLVTYKGHFDQNDRDIMDAWKRAVEVHKKK